MIIEKAKSVLVVRFNNFRKFDFVAEHNKIASQDAGVWLVKMGRGMASKMVKRVIDESGVVIFKGAKSIGGNYYVARVIDFYNGKAKEDMNYPSYYKELEREGFPLEGTWIRITELRELSEEVARNFFVINSKANLQDVLGITRTPVLYVTADEDIFIEV